MFVYKIRESKLTSLMLVFLLILQTVVGIFMPVTVFFDSHYIQSVETAKAYGESWYETGGTWEYRKQIVIDHTKVANTDQLNFPVVLSFTDSMLKDSSNGGHVAQSSGEDILFTSSEGSAKLSHEIEYYDNTTGEMVIWVKIPILSVSEDTILYMYYGNDSCANQEDATNVWDSNYAMVQHMDDTTTSTISDSTSNDNDGIKKAANESIEATGKIGRAQSFDGIDDYIEVADDTSYRVADEFTLSAWVKLESNDSWGYFLYTGDYGFGMGYYDGDHELYFVRESGSSFTAGTNGYPFTVGEWYYVVERYDGYEYQYYLNGVMIMHGAGYITGNLQVSSTPMRIGGDVLYSNEHFSNSTLDEMHISKVYRSNDWFSTEYNNQIDPKDFCIITGEESHTPEFLSSWNYRKAINIDHANVINIDQNNFPVLINISSDEDLSSFAKSDGGDILFTSSNVSWDTGNTRDVLNYEIESYDATTGSLQAWVEIPTLSTNENTTIYTYFGNSSFSRNLQDPSILWQSYETVYHMKDDSSITSSDSVFSSNDLTKKSATEPVEISGKIGNAQSFDGVDDYLSSPDVLNLDMDSEITLESWVKSSNSSWQKVKVLNISNSNALSVITVSYDEDMNSDFSDLRFIDANGTLLRHEVLGYTASMTADVMLEFSSAPASETVYMYYGNTLASNISTDVGMALDSTPWVGRYNHQSIVFNDKIWVLGGMDSGYRYLNDVWSSSDGVNWTEETTHAPWSARYGHQVIVFNDKIWVIGGRSSSARLNDIWSSSDGVNWTQETANALWPVRYAHEALVFNDKIWVMGGYGNSYVAFNDVWSSSDGINWTQETAAASWLARYNHQSLIFNNKIWVLGGYTKTSGYVNDVWSSTDGINWTEETSHAGWSNRYNHQSLIFNDKIWVMGGASFYNDIWSSTDGVNWVEENNNPSWHTRNGHQALVFNEEVWLMGGFYFDYSDFSSTYFKDVWSSSDGTNWNQEGLIRSATTFGEEVNVSGGLGTILGKGTNYNLTANDSDLPLNNWTYLTLTNDGTTQKYYINGELVSSQAKTIPAVNNNSLKIGDGYFSIPFSGIIDEVRISSTTRTADWIKTNYNTQASPSTFYTLSSRETYGVDVPSNFHFDTNYGDKITAMWDGGDNDPTTEYYIENTTTGENSGWVTGLNTYTFENLTCDTYYTFRVKARYNTLETIYNTETVSTAHCGPVIIPTPNTNNNNNENTETNNNEENEEGENENVENSENNNETNTENNNASNNSEQQNNNSSNEETISELTTVITQYLSSGDRNEDVKNLQTYLKQLNFFPQDIEANGNFGPTTLQAVKEFQKSHGINPTGYVGPITFKALNNQPILSNPSYEYKRDLKYNDRGEDVVELQNNLKERAFFPKSVPSTGWFGPITYGAVNWFKGVYGFIQDGIVDGAMREVLGKAN